MPDDTLKVIYGQPQATIRERRGPAMRRMRERRGFTQEEVAKRLGVSRRAVGNWEVDGACPAADVAVIWRAILGLTWTEYEYVFTRRP